MVNPNVYLTILYYISRKYNNSMHIVNAVNISPYISATTFTFPSLPQKLDMSPQQVPSVNIR